MEALNFIIASIPIVFIIIGLGIMKQPAHNVVPIVLVVTILIVLIHKDLSIINTGLALAEGTVMGIWPIITVIIAAIFTYKMADDEKDMDIIKNMLSNVSSDRRITVLLVVWGFGNFLEGVAGYGTAVAIPVSILITMGFDPAFACLLCLIMNTCSTAYGSVGIPIISLAQTTGLDVQQLATAVAIQLIIPVMIIPFILVILTGNGLRAIKGVFTVTLLSGFCIAITQIVITRTLGPELPSILGSILSMIITIVWTKLFMKDKDHQTIPVCPKKAFLAWLPYIMIVTLILLVSPMIKEIHEFLQQFTSSITIYPKGPPINFQWLLTPGPIIFFSTTITYLIRGISPIKIIKTFINTIKKMSLSFLVIICIVSISRLMTHSLMIKDIANGISNLTGYTYPLFSTLIGALGTFLTGSDTASNILFGPLQIQIAENLGQDHFWLAAANTTGATGGKMISPQNITIATTTAGLIGQEGKILAKTIIFSLGYIIITGIFILFRI